MKKRIISILLAGVIVLTAAGCSSLFEAEYHYSAPYSDDIGHIKGDATEISNYSMLKSALINLISRHEEHGEFRFSRYNGSVTDDLAAACFEVKASNPVGAYAVDTLTYDTSRIVSYYVADVQIAYKKTAAEISDIVGISNLTDLEERLREMLSDYAPGMVLRVYSSTVDVNYIERQIRSFYLSDPVSFIFEPQVSIETYPSEGINRIYDIRLNYGRSTDDMKMLTEILSAAVEDAAAGMTETETAMLALECAGRLSDRLENGRDYGTYESTAYGALVEQHADSKGTALGYKALCNALGIECMVIDGNIGTMGTEEHFWNIIELYGDYYHVDVSRFGENPETAFLLDDDSLWGAYIWETADYPECRGGLRYRDLVPKKEPEKTEPLPGGDTDETPAPEETPAAETELPDTSAEPLPSVEENNREISP